MRLNSNFFMVLCLATGIVANAYIIYRLTIGFKLSEFFKQNQNAIPNCEIDINDVMSFVETRHFLELEEMEKKKENNKNHEKTVQSLLYAFDGGGLGNKLFEMISLLGIANTLKRKPVINSTNAGIVKAISENIQPIFPNLVEQFHLKILPPESVVNVKMNWVTCCIFDDPSKLLNSSDTHLNLNGHYFQSFKYFNHMRPQIRQWLTPRKLTAVRAEMLLPAKFRKGFLICTHVRRGDFTSDGVHQPSDANFTRSATDFLVALYKKSHRNVNVVVLGNDVQFAEAVFRDRSNNFTFLPKLNSSALNYSIPEVSPEYTAILTPTLAPDIDLAFSRLFCDVTLITAPSSTFAWWLSYLAKRRAVTYYRDIEDSKDGVANEMIPQDFYLPEWVRLKMDVNRRISTFY